MRAESKFAAAALVVALALSPLAAAPPAPTLTVTPDTATIDAPFDVVVTGAPAGERVTLRATRRTDAGAPWTAVGIYQADETGTVRTASSPSLGGTYEGVSPYGLICAALPVEPAGLGAYIANFATSPQQPRTFLAPLARTRIEITASAGGQVAGTTAWRSYAEGTSGEPIADPSGWRGVYFPPAEGVPIGAPVLVLAGSGGGVFDGTAALLASHGHPSLALAMFRYPGLADSLLNYPIERVRDAALWLAKRSGKDKAVVWGVSRGSEAAALAAVNFPEAFDGVILVAPSHFADAGALGPAAKPGDSAWTIGGRPTVVTDVGFTPDDPRVIEQAKTVPGYNASSFVLALWDSPEFEEKYGIAFERIAAPVLVLAAGDDAVWPSWISAEHIRRRLVDAGKAEQVEVHVYPHAGHSFVRPAAGTVLSTFSYHPLLQGFQAVGGEPNANCAASFDSVKVMLSFLARLETQPRVIQERTTANDPWRSLR